MTGRGAASFEGWLPYQSVLSLVLFVTNSTPLTCGYRRLMSTIAHDAMPFLCRIGPTYCHKKSGSWGGGDC